jgi:hypothetical protein
MSCILGRTLQRSGCFCDRHSFMGYTTSMFDSSSDAMVVCIICVFTEREWRRSIFKAVAKEHLTSRDVTWSYEQRIIYIWLAYTWHMDNTTRRECCNRYYQISRLFTMLNIDPSPSLRQRSNYAVFQQSIFIPIAGSSQCDQVL